MFETLKKIYYKYPQKYEYTYKSRFDNELSVKLVFTHHKYPLFYLPIEEINKLLFEIMIFDKNISELKSELPLISIKQFKRKCLIDEIMQTNSIEGVNSTRKEIKEAYDEPLSTNKKFHGIVSKYNKLTENEINIFTNQDIRKIFDDIVSNEIKSDDETSLPDGLIYRKESVSIISSSNKEIHRGLNPEKKIINAMDEALNVLNNNEINPLIRVSIFHYLLGYIHPFYDGNGRLSRFIRSYYFSKTLNELIGYRLSYTIKNRIKDYYNSFENANDDINRGELTHFILNFLSILKESMENLNSALNERSIKLNYFKELLMKNNNIEEKTKSIIYLLIQAELFSEDGITINELKSNSDIGLGTIKNRINVIEGLGILKVDKLGRVNHYGIDLEKLVLLI